MVWRLGLIMTFLMLWLVLPVGAQDSAIEPPLPVIPVEEAADLIMAALISILVGVVDSPLTTLVVGLLKRIPLLDDVAANTLQFVVAGVITVVYWGSAALGYGAEFNSVAAFLLSIAPALAGLIGRQLASAGVYRLAVKADLGVVGYQRGNLAPDPYQPRKESRHDYSGGLG